MAITLITGLPGHGKTLYTLAKYHEETQKDFRPVFHNNIPGLTIPNWQTIDAKEWASAPTGALVIIDEAQFVFPVRGRTQPPEFIEKLATHRHLGLDLVLITQNPMLLDPFVRRLIDRHYHVVRKFGTQFATIHEFPTGCRDNVHVTRKDSIRHEWKYPKEVFEWYKSSEQHTVKARIPAKVYFLFSVPFIFAGLAYSAYARLNPDAQHDRMIANLPPGQVAPNGTPTQTPPPPVEKTPLQYAQDYVKQFTAAVPGLPHTAPIYAEVTKPTLAPYPVGCITSKTSCQCYTEQGTKMTMDLDLCRSIIADGFFKHWGQPEVQATASPSQSLTP